MLFDDVRFMPGELADQLLSVFRLESKPLVELRDPVSVRITDGKVFQKGLVVPVANVASVSLDGSVDFDKNLDMVARFALNAPRHAGAGSFPAGGFAVRASHPGNTRQAQDRLRSHEGEMESLWKQPPPGLARSGRERSAKDVRRDAGSTAAAIVSTLTPQSDDPRGCRRLKDERRKDRVEKKAARARGRGNRTRLSRRS